MIYVWAMKKIIFLFAFTSFSVFGFADYQCSVRQYRVDLSIDGQSSHMWLFDGFEVVGQSYVSWIETKEKETTFHFYPGNEGPAKLIFKNEDVANLPKKMRVWIDAKANGWSIWDYLDCNKVN